FKSGGFGRGRGRGRGSGRSRDGSERVQRDAMVDVTGVVKNHIAENERHSIERDKTLADLSTWPNQISRHEGEVEFASFFKEVICTEVEQLKCVRDCLQALVEGRYEVISNEQKSIDELAQASKYGKYKVAKLDGKIMNGVSEMMRSRNKIIKIKKAKKGDY
nr:hypothetical protein [Tanacetum cinerariifolium]